jgi:hypothetical protein
VFTEAPEAGAVHCPRWLEMFTGGRGHLARQGLASCVQPGRVGTRLGSSGCTRLRDGWPEQHPVDRAAAGPPLVHTEPTGRCTQLNRFQGLQRNCEGTAGAASCGRRLQWTTGDTIGWIPVCRWIGTMAVTKGAFTQHRTL